MPLDTGELADDLSRSPSGDRLSVLRPARIVLQSTGHLGTALRAARESIGLGEDDIAQVTRIRPAYIAALESFDFDDLPARPFVVGYVRAYARALGIDDEAVVTRFHAEAPRADGKLRAPGGVRHDAFANIRWLILAGAVVALAVLVWNVTRRAEMRPAHPLSLVTQASPSTRRNVGPALIGAPLPTPPEATTPPVYETPGLEATVADKAAVAPTASALTDGPPGVPGAAFVPSGTVYGARTPAAPPAQDVVLQARKSTALVVRGAGGAVYFAQVLKPGDAWRAPDAAGLTVDTGSPGSVEVFVGGISRGRLLAAQAPLGRLAVP